jgi:acyl carrier protein
MGNFENKIKKIVSKILLIEESKVVDQLSRKDIETWDSLSHLMLINEVESAFGVTFNDDDIVEINTIGILKEKIKRLIKR